VSRHDRIAERDHVHAEREHRVGDPPGHHRVTEHHRHDRVLAGQQFEAGLGHQAAELRGVRAQPVPLGAAAGHEVERGE
jgi:hypothetical protein